MHRRRFPTVRSRVKFIPFDLSINLTPGCTVGKPSVIEGQTGPGGPVKGIKTKDAKSHCPQKRSLKALRD